MTNGDNIIEENKKKNNKTKEKENINNFEQNGIDKSGIEKMAINDSEKNIKNINKKNSEKKSEHDGVLKKIAKAFVKGVIFGYCKLIYRVKIIGKENIPEEGPLIFCGNHRTYLDPQLIVVTSGRDMRFLAKEELNNNPFFALLGKLFNVICVKRDEKDLTAVKESLKTLKSGNCIGIFPEGTRNGFEKNNGQIKSGAAYLAIKTNAKIIPIGIIGKAKPFTKNAIIYGRPLDFSDYKKLGKESEEKASELLKNKIVELASTDIKALPKA